MPVSPLSMIIEAMNGGTLQPRGGRYVSGRAPWFSRGLLVCRALAVHFDRRVLLVDTGIGLVDVAVPWRRLGPAFLSLFAPALRASECVARQLEARGIPRESVTDVVLTHLDPDCAGGLNDFPDAKVHLNARELEASQQRSSLRDKVRYRPAQWAHGPRWNVTQTEDEHWFGFAASKPLPEIDVEVRHIALPGHSTGHCGVAIRTASGWVLHVGDAVLDYSSLKDNPLSESAARAHLEGVLEENCRLRKKTLEQLRQLVRDHGSEVQLFCSHDPSPHGLGAPPSEIP